TGGRPFAQPATGGWNTDGAVGRTDPTALHTPPGQWPGNGGPGPAGYPPATRDSGPHGGYGAPGYSRPADDRADGAAAADRPARRGPLIAALAVVAVAVAAGGLFLGQAMGHHRFANNDSKP